MTPRRPTSRTAFAGAALALGLIIAGCAEITPTATDTPATDTAAAAGGPATEGQMPGGGHNSADTEFAQMMIEHHVGAIEMADLALERASTPEVLDLAERIRAAQGPEIDQMTSWLEGEGEPTTAGNMTGMDHGSMEMDGLDQTEAMADLEQTSGTDFDRRFLQLMIAHHAGALEMATAQLDDGISAEMRTLAESVISAQEAEIAEMEELLDTL